MKKVFVGIFLALASYWAQALTPYFYGDKLAAGDLKTAMTTAEQKLVAAGFTVVGRHLPAGIPGHGVLIATEPGLLATVATLGGKAIVAAPIRVGVKADGTVSYVNLEYWLRAYLRTDYGKAEAAMRAAAEKLEKALGKGKAFGGEVKAEDLANYRYMAGMERFGDKSELKTYASFDEAVKTIQDNLAKGVAKTAKVYEVVIPEKKLAVFGVATNDPEDGEGWWVNKIGAEHIAALPWEVFVVDNKAYALYGRFRTALAWPDLGMFQFMKISSHPDSTHAMMAKVAGGSYSAQSN